MLGEGDVLQGTFGVDVQVFTIPAFQSREIPPDAVAELIRASAGTSM